MVHSSTLTKVLFAVVFSHTAFAQWNENFVTFVQRKGDAQDRLQTIDNSRSSSWMVFGAAAAWSVGTAAVFKNQLARAPLKKNRLLQSFLLIDAGLIGTGASLRWNANIIESRFANNAVIPEYLQHQITMSDALVEAFANSEMGGEFSTLYAQSEELRAHVYGMIDKFADDQQSGMDVESSLAYNCTSFVVMATEALPSHDLNELKKKAYSDSQATLRDAVSKDAKLYNDLCMLSLSPYVTLNPFDSPIVAQ